MKQNLGRHDRLLRFALGAALLVIALATRSTSAALWGLFTLYEALAGWCVVYQLLGRNTCPLKNNATRLDWAKYFILGLQILTTAIILNLLASYVGLTTWYNFLQNPTKVLSLDNYVFLFVAYPFILGLSTKNQLIKTG
ncbi:DUF2892 domain-containing protein [Candidatus Nomurabacteria bacterium]|uniref:DUF2892 domain-containing protein n=1 Tax=candidate division WWE3 bacterium TaxID=2053526 RepID=A0A955E081_UNCKA|nr:DUF2892 domain-containing protein [candidate division WWE3 bacterium]MCB9823607.1 DUF2892 domain-containing protein [Candidatus Nomurabacteria bacterium]MCB9827402.1 DUF2892 domain-containing protein [Candidatus Nomurabacteria bacterium]HXK52651.1 DUF2892 domain-containing protein [bacterium]